MLNPPGQIKLSEPFEIQNENPLGYPYAVLCNCSYNCYLGPAKSASLTFTLTVQQSRNKQQ